MNVSCVICSINYTDKDKVVHPACGHLFHQRCLEKWFDRYSYCAQCRQQSDKEYVRVYLNFDNSFQTINSPIPEDHIDRNENQLRQKYEALKNELRTTKKNLAEMETVNLALQSIPEHNYDLETRYIQKQLSAALETLEVCEKENDELKKFISNENNFNTSDDNGFQNQFEQILDENEKLTNKINEFTLKIIHLEQENGKLKFEEQARSHNEFELIDFKDYQTKYESSSSEEGAKSYQDQLQKRENFKQKFDQIKKDTVYNTYGHLDKKIEQMNKRLGVNANYDLLFEEYKGKNKTLSNSKKNKKK